MSLLEQIELVVRESFSAGGPGSGRHPYGLKSKVKKVDPKKQAAIQDVLKQTAGNARAAWTLAHKQFLSYQNKDQKKASFWQSVRDSFGVQKQAGQPLYPANIGEQRGIRRAPSLLEKQQELGKKLGVPTAPLYDKFAAPGTKWIKDRPKLAPTKAAPALGKRFKAGGPGSGRHPYGRKPKPLPKPRQPQEPLTDKQKKGLASNWHRVDKVGQDKAEYNEEVLAKVVKGTNFKDSEPIDVIIRNGGRMIGLEIKTLLVQADKIRNGKNLGPKLTMNKGAVPRKYEWADKTKGELYTVVIDHRPFSKDFGAIYMRQGAGSWNTTLMTHIGYDFRNVGKELKLDKSGAEKIGTPIVPHKGGIMGPLFPRSRKDFGLPKTHTWAPAPKGVRV